MDGHRHGKNQMLINIPRVMINPHLKNIHCHCRDNAVTFSQHFSAYRWQHDVGRSYHVTGPRDLQISVLLVSNIILYAITDHRFKHVQIADSYTQYECAILVNHPINLAWLVLWIKTLTTEPEYHHLRDVTEVYVRIWLQTIYSTGRLYIHAPIIYS